ncbi:MAG: hypothetical protein M9916_11195 [Crocinitomicaceae bacterium]|nr:hypothetical protein [Crocinitomicaceae bacterium]
MKNIVKRTAFFTLLLAGIILSSGCNKGCKSLGENVTTGEIKTGVYIYPRSGYMTSFMKESEYLITGSNPYADRYQISFDKGETKKSINYNEYSLLCYPITTSCFAQFDRDVKIDDVNGVVKYTIKVKQCGKCKEERLTENYVAIRAVPSTYQVVFDIDIQSAD